MGPYIPYGLFQTTGETCAKFGSDRFRNEKLRKQIIESTWRDKGWIG